jgi:hypothetical protein
MESNRSHEDAWIDAATRLAVESHKLLLQMKRVERAHRNCKDASRKCMDQAFSDKFADNPLSGLMKAMGVGYELSRGMKEASYRDAAGHMRIGQVADLLNGMGCIPEPSGVQEDLEAMQVAFREKYGYDLETSLQNSMGSMAEQDKEADDGSTGESGGPGSGGA